jgi:HK97 family phage prohead protease
MRRESADGHGGHLHRLASAFDNLDPDGDVVRRGTFGESVGSGPTPIPLVWMHKADDPRCSVGDVVEATETDDGLAIKGRFDRDTEFGKSA